MLKSGSESVLSTITSGRPTPLGLAFAAFTARRMSVIISVGLAGVSINTMARCLAERMASSICAVARRAPGMPFTPQTER